METKTTFKPDNVMRYIHAAGFSVLALLGLFLCWLVIGIRSDSAKATNATVGAMTALTQDGKTVAWDTGAESAKLGNTLDAVTAVANSANGTMKQTTVTLASLQTTSGTLNTAVTTLQPQITQAVTRISQSAQTAIKGWTPVEATAKIELSSLNDLTNNINRQVTGDAPYAHNMLVSMNGITANADGITGDLYAKEHAWFYPAPCKTRRCHISRMLDYLPMTAQILGIATQTHDLIKGSKVYGQIEVKK